MQLTYVGNDNRISTESPDIVFFDDTSTTRDLFVFALTHEAWMDQSGMKLSSQEPRMPGTAWNAVKSAVSALVKPRHLHLRTVHTPPLQAVEKKRASRWCHKFQAAPHGASFTALDFVDYGLPLTPHGSVRQCISRIWRELHGLRDWEGLLDPLNPILRREIIKYGELAQATYDGFDFNPLSEFFGNCRFNQPELLDRVNLPNCGYKVTKYIYATSHLDLPGWLVKSCLGESWSQDFNWIGYVAVSDDEETARIGRRDIVMAWRGTVAPTEWIKDLEAQMGNIGDGNVKVHHGFLSVYKSKVIISHENQRSASQQVIGEVERLMKFYKESRSEEPISFTVTGHSLGGALALLNAYEAATLFLDLHVSVISFAGPKVGNNAFKLKLKELGVRVLRVVVAEDLVPSLPPSTLLLLPYKHVGTKLEISIHLSHYLKHGRNLQGRHNLEVYLHLVDCFVNKESESRKDAKRNVILVNKGTNMLIEQLRIPPFFYKPC